MKTTFMDDILISRSSGGINCLSLKPWPVKFYNLIKATSHVRGDKRDGSHFLRCSGTQRTQDQLSNTAGLIILHAHSRINEIGQIVRGAPDPYFVHNVLVDLDLSHIIYTSYYNGMTKEELEAESIESDGAYYYDYFEYQILIPCKYTQDQLPSLVAYIFKHLHKNQIMLAGSKENLIWDQICYHPRMPENRKELFVHYDHTGYELDIATITAEPEADHNQKAIACEQKITENLLIPAIQKTSNQGLTREISYPFNSSSAIEPKNRITESTVNVSPQAQTKSPGKDHCDLCSHNLNKALAEKKSDKSEAIDPWYKRIEDWIKSDGDDKGRKLLDRYRFPLSDVLTYALGLPPYIHTRQSQMRASTILKSLGYYKDRMQINGKRQVLWVKRYGNWPPLK